MAAIDNDIPREGGHIVLFGNSAAVAWVWGLGFFFSIHFSFLYGLPGLLAFAVPNALGLALFGILIDRLSQDRDVEKWFFASARNAPLTIFVYQIVAISITVFGFANYFWGPAIGVQVMLGAVGFLALGSFIGELLRLRGVVIFHAGISFGCLGLVVLFFFLTPWPAGALTVPARAEYDVNFASVLIPLIVGLLVGPWFDIQQWQRAIALNKRKSSVSLGFLWAAVIFFAYILVIGTITLALTRGMDVSAFLGPDGKVNAESALTTALVEQPILLILFGIAATCVLVSTIDSAKVALTWYLSKEKGALDSPLVALIPEKVFVSAAPHFLIALVIALAMLQFGGSLKHLMILFGTVFVGFSAQFAWAAFCKSNVASFHASTASAGLVALIALAIGYFEDLPWLMVIAPFIPLTVLFAPKQKAEGVQIDVEPTGQPQVPFSPKPAAASAAAGGMAAGAAYAPPQPGDVQTLDGASVPVNMGPIHSLISGLEGKTFFHRLTATYADTNSVGNIYFANYFMWVGKTRELFFRQCMPDFDLKKTDFFILTRSFTHKFLQEAREFDEITVKLHIERFNRKFVTMAHTIEAADGRLLGKGEQSLMFVQSDNYQLTDIPKSVYNAFLPYA